MNESAHYDELERDGGRHERPVRDLSRAWGRLRPVAEASGVERTRIETFCGEKGISFSALEALGTRFTTREGGRVTLGWATYNGRDVPTAVKLRELGGQRRAEPGSVYVEPLVVGKRSSLDWFVAEGETDAARLYDLVGDVATILVLPAGAKAFKPAWAAMIPRGATVHLCHDADGPGDEGAAKAARLIGGRSVRLRPPIDGGDWSDWHGDREEFVEFVRAARQGDDGPFALPLEQFIAATSDVPPVLVGDDQEALLPAAGLIILFARGGKGKTTLTVDAAFHFASGADWLGFAVPRPLNVLLIENEGPREPFRSKLEVKHKVWPHPLTGSIHVATLNWGALTLKDSGHVSCLRDYIVEHEIDLVVGDPLDSLGLEGVGSPEDTREFMGLLAETGLFRDVAWWLLAHARKESASDELDAISGAWGGRPDTMLMLEKRDGDRARLSFPKIRWSRRGTRAAYILTFDPDSEAFEVAHEESDEERDYLTEIDELLADGTWRTAKEIAAPKDARGIGASEATVKGMLDQHPDRYVARTGDAAKEVGRHSTATVWQVRRGQNAPNAPTDFRGAEERGASVRSPIGDAPIDAPQLPLSRCVNSPDSPQLDSDGGAT